MLIPDWWFPVQMAEFIPVAVYPKGASAQYAPQRGLTFYFLKDSDRVYIHKWAL